MMELLASFLSYAAIQLLHVASKCYKNRVQYWIRWIDPVSTKSLDIDDQLPHELGVVVRGLYDTYLVSYLQKVILEWKDAVDFHASDPNFSPSSEHRGDHHIIHTLLLQMRTQISAIIGKQLVPLYGNCKLYKKGAILVPHTDLSHLQYTVTVSIMKSSPLLIVNPLTKMLHRVQLEPGDAFIFKGDSVVHGRPSVESDFYQLFFHYISKSDINEDNLGNVFDYPNVTLQ